GIDLRKNPRDFGYSQNLWDGKLLSHHLKEKYSIVLGTRQCQTRVWTSIKKYFVLAYVVTCSIN
ncbi:MAG: hypothetical protein M1411_00645, partial [Candidatus Thermoplasmatota archaeon]|nr:hypothetical protein [Candidatus Thermoplasmatota archaeon]